QMQKAAKVVTLYEMRAFSPKMQELADIAVQCAALTQEAFTLLPAMRKNHDRLNVLTEQITDLEARSDDLYDAGMKALYEAHRHDVTGGNTLGFIIGSQLLDHLEKVIDRFEDVANRINGVLVGHLWNDHGSRLPDPGLPDRRRPAVRLPERPARCGILYRHHRRHARPAADLCGRVGGLLQLHRLPVLRAARCGHDRPGHHLARRHFGSGDLRRPDGRHSLERHHLDVRDSVVQF